MADTGTIQVRVFTSRAQIPVEDATVVVTQHGLSGKYQILSMQVTDSSGNVPPVTVDTPDTKESTSPNGDVPPFAQCDIWVEHPSYELVLIEDAQVFSQVDSLQLVELTPVVEGESWIDRPDVREIPSQDL